MGPRYDYTDPNEFLREQEEGLPQTNSNTYTDYTDPNDFAQGHGAGVTVQAGPGFRQPLASGHGAGQEDILTLDPLNLGGGGGGAQVLNTGEPNRQMMSEAFRQGMEFGQAGGFSAGRANRNIYQDIANIMQMAGGPEAFQDRKVSISQSSKNFGFADINALPPDVRHMLTNPFPTQHQKRLQRAFYGNLPAGQSGASMDQEKATGRSHLPDFFADLDRTGQQATAAADQAASNALAVEGRRLGTERASLATERAAATRGESQAERDYYGEAEHKAYLDRLYSAFEADDERRAYGAMPERTAEETQAIRNKVDQERPGGGRGGGGVDPAIMQALQQRDLTFWKMGRQNGMPGIIAKDQNGKMVFVPLRK